MMRAIRVCLIALLTGWSGLGWAATEQFQSRTPHRKPPQGKSIDELPKDALDVAFAWTEPIKQVARETRRFDPISGLWFGLIEGSVKTVERTVNVFLPKEKGRPDPEFKSGKALIRYQF